MPLRRLVKGKMRRVPAEPPLERKIERLYIIAMNFDARFVALEAAIARLQNNQAATPKRTRKSITPTSA